jgi:hypothetical protein
MGIAPAVITASASIVVAVTVFVANQIAQLRNERRQAALTRLSAQLRELYGPLFALVAVNEHLWTAMRQAWLPEHDRRQSGSLSDEQAEEWQRWLQEGLMPANVKMRDLIMQHADLIVERDMPHPLQSFCAHVASYEVYLARPDKMPIGRALIRHPGALYVTHVRDRFANLKAEQTRLVGKRTKFFGRTTPSLS